MPELYKIGTRVILPMGSSPYTDSQYNPYYGGKYGNTVGTIVKLELDANHCITVRWDKYGKACYRKGEVVPIQDIGKPIRHPMNPHFSEPLPLP